MTKSQIKKKRKKVSIYKRILVETYILANSNETLYNATNVIRRFTEKNTHNLW
jgi:hypothetical protein